jgi:uncharacterized iron-regulated protein
MRCLALLLLIPISLLTPSFAAAPPPKHSELLKQIRELEKQIEAVRGLKFNTPVVAEIISRPKEADASIQGYYDIAKKTLFVYDDVKGNYAKGVLIHEMVHALQDQHFKLSKLHSETFGSDAELAVAALIEGDASYTMIEVLEKEQPHVAFMLKTTLEKAKDPQRALLYGLGAKYVQTLKKKGGWEAVNLRYRFTPTSTATILHPEERIMPVKLGPGKVTGEFGLIKRLLAHEKTRPEAVKALQGWRGDRVMIDTPKQFAQVVAFASADQAETYRKAVSIARELEPKRGARSEVVVRGNRVYEIVAQDDALFKLTLDRIDGPPSVQVLSTKDGQKLTFGQMIDRLMEADTICIGETHDSELHHQIQLMVIKSLHARDPRLGVGMEMFQRPFQKSLDRYIAGAIDEASMLEDSEYKKRWGYEWSLYRPIVDFCKRNQIALAGLNLSDELRAKVRSSGYEKLAADDKKLLGEVDFQVAAHRKHWFDQLGQMHGHGGTMSDADKEKFYAIMTLWDEYMADSAAKFQQERKLRRLVILAGSGHIDLGFGIPDRVAKRTKGVVKTIGIEFAEGLNPRAKPGLKKESKEEGKKEEKKPTNDYIILVE